MSFLKKLFGDKETPEKDRPLPCDIAALVKGNGWYLATAHNNRVRQIVLTLPPTCACESKFSGLMLLSHYRVTQKNWVTEVFIIDGDPGAYLIVRADGVTSKLRGHTTRLAFGFNHMKAGGVFSIHVNVDCPPATRREIGDANMLLDTGLLPTHSGQADANIGFECVIGLDTERAVDLYGRFVGQPTKRICFAEPTKNAALYYHTPTGMKEAASPQGKFDLVSDVPSDCLSALEREWSDLLSYHKTVSRPDFQTAVNDLWSFLPQFQEKCPIIPPA